MADDQQLYTLKDPASSEKYFIRKDITDLQIKELIFFSHNDTQVSRFTSDPTRFKDEQAFLRWTETEKPTYYTLSDEGENLLGLIWFHSLQIPWKENIDGVKPKKFGITYAIRLYHKARGKGLSLPFTQKALEDFKETEQYKNDPHKRIWLAVSPDNLAAISTYKKAGFKELGLREDGRKLIMVLGN